jgi:predicted O-linked N-acetylglucosamine transferase (SPINDLY family)
MMQTELPTATPLTAEQALQQAIGHHQAGQLQDAERLYRAILQHQPQHPDANHNLGVLAVQFSRPSASLMHFQQALNANPGRPQFWLSYVDALLRAGQLELSAQVFAQARRLGLNGNEAEALAARLQASGAAAEPLHAPTRQEVDALPTLFGQGRHEEAERAARALTDRFPLNGQGWKALGVSLKALKRKGDEALRSFRQAADLLPGDAEAQSNLGLALQESGHAAEAESRCRLALKINPNMAEAHFNLALALQDLNRVDEAQASYRKAIELKPAYAEAHYNLALTLQHFERLDEAAASYRDALRHKPDFPGALNNLGHVLKDLGRMAEAQDCLRQALALKPDYSQAHSNLVFNLDLVEGATVAQQQAERRRWNEQHGRKHAPAIKPHLNHPDPQRRLRVGFVSADFRRHSAYYAFSPILLNLDRAAFDVICYSGVKVEDDATARLRQVVHEWRPMFDVEDDELAQMIRRDRIDILVDLSGHSAGNRLPVFARKPAPVQIAAWGATSTGLKTMDYYLADAVAVPQEERSLYAEEVLDLPCILCYEPPGYLPDMSSLPALAKPLTFGCVNRVEKITDQAIALWGRIFSALPEAQLLLKDRAYDDQKVRQQLLQRFGTAGIAADRVRFMGRSPHPEHLKVFRDIDIGLDPFPQGGGISTAEALWMGVPVVSLLGPTVPSRATPSILVGAGLPDWVAHNEEEYVSVAVRAAHDLKNLAHLREGMRTRMAKSPLSDIRAYTRATETIFRAVWQRWCNDHPVLPGPSPQDTEALANLIAEGKIADAASAAQAMTERFPRNGFGWKALGVAYAMQGRQAEALPLMQKAAELMPDDAEAHNNLGLTLQECGRLAEAEASCRRALQLRPDFAEAYSNLSNILKDLGELDSVEANYRRALELKPDYALAHSNLIFILDLLEGVTVAQQQAERRRWNEQHGRKHAPAIKPHLNLPDPQRRLRVGFVSADFRRHSAFFAFGPILLNLDRNLFDVICYSEVKVEDDVTAVLRSNSIEWRSTVGIPDEALAEQIRRDRIDILVDLSGHSAGNRLPVFARKPAPVQVAAWGATSTGLEAMDYYIADAVAVPQEERRLYAEEVIDLPCILCYEPPGYLPDMSPLPALGKPLTFGCINRVEKITDQVIALWGRIFAALPEAQLLLKDRAYDVPKVRQQILQRLSAAGIAAERVRLLGRSLHPEHLRVFQEVDIALDPYPQGGGISTAEALWMGVPVVSLLGPTVPSRATASILIGAGLPGWVAHSEEEYVKIAVQAARNPKDLARLREGMRERMGKSPLSDIHAYTRATEALFRSIWQRWCNGHRAPSGPTPVDTEMVAALIAERRFAEAAPAAHAMTERFPLDGFGWKALGVVYALQGRDADALPLMQKAIELMPHDAEAHKNLAQLLRKLGRLSDAEPVCRRAVELKPGHPDACSTLAGILQALGRHSEAEPYYRQVLQADAGNVAAYLGLARSQAAQQRMQDAEATLRQALAHVPESVDALIGLGEVLQAQGKLAEVEASFRHALELRPDLVELQNNLANLLKSMGRTDEAEARYKLALQMKPDFAIAHNNLGTVYRAQGRLDEALACFRRAIELSPDYFDPHNNLGLLLQDVGKAVEAEASCRRALQLRPDSEDAHFNLSLALQNLGRLHEAEQHYRSALELKPGYAEAHVNLGNILKDSGRLEEAQANYRRALELKPDLAMAYNNLANTYKVLGRLDETVAYLRKALELKPDYSETHSNLVFILDLMEGVTVAEQQAERRRWNEMHGRKFATTVKPHSNDPDPRRKLRVGFVSADFRRHSAYYTFSPILLNLDRKAFDVICYSGVKLEDDATVRLREAVSEWSIVTALSDDVLAEKIRDDRIDILVDLSGHSAGNRLPVFARKPAPVQVAAWGATSTGLEAMDYYFADAVTVPKEERGLYAEQVVDLPCILCYQPPDYLPDVSPLPALSKPFTFGCINRVEKITNDVIALWGRIFGALPKAHLLLKDRTCDSISVRNGILQRLAAVGIASDQVHILGHTPHLDHLKVLQGVDVGLDPFPQGGGVSTAEALWMGVPVVSLLGPTVPSRATPSILTGAGLPGWVAHSEEEYLKIAVHAASDLQSLARMRMGLRARMAKSPLCDVRAYTKATEAAFRSIWRRWCEEQQSKPAKKKRTR